VAVPFKESSAPLKDIAQIIVKDPQTLLVHVHEEEVCNYIVYWMGDNIGKTTSNNIIALIFIL
jgi:ribosome recycling factor